MQSAVNSSWYLVRAIVFAIITYNITFILLKNCLQKILKKTYTIKMPTTGIAGYVSRGEFIFLLYVLLLLPKFLK